MEEIWVKVNPINNLGMELFRRAGSEFGAFDLLLA
jgi:hypothetical protein